MANKIAARCNNQYLKISENYIKTVTAIETGVRLKATSTQSNAGITHIYICMYVCMFFKYSECQWRNG